MKQTSDTAFAPDWLALREPADHAARDTALLSKAAGLVGPATTVLDLGSGTGSTLRAFERAGFNGLTWRLLDSDAALLSLAADQHPNAQTAVSDLSRVESIDLSNASLVTASALLDLMSHDWVSALADRLFSANLPFYVALSYDGEMSWTPEMVGDDAVCGHFNAHQQRDKGTGPALGPTAGPAAAQTFETLGFDVFVAQSPWSIGPDQPALHTQLLDGIADAVADFDATLARTWGDARKAAVGTSRATIGHLDLLAVPKTKT